jgi:predicted permease
MNDIRYAIRSLFKNRAFATVALLTLALGIGATTAIFSLVHGVLLKPLPYPEPQQLVHVWMRFTGIGLPDDRNWVSAPEFRDVAEGHKSFSHVAAIGGAGFTLHSGGRPERVVGATVSPSFFPMLGVQPLHGRVFTADEGTPGKNTVVILGHALWQRAFGGDPGVIGRTITVNGEPNVVVGVAPARFEYPDEVEMWRPIAFDADALAPNNRGSHGLQVLARIKPGVSLEQARADMALLSDRIIRQASDYPYKQFNFAIILSPLLEELVGDVQTALWIMLGAVAFVLLIACANIANLLLARAAARERELAVRTAMGASRGRLVRQLLTESVALAVAGGAAGLLVAYWFVTGMVAAGDTTVPRIADVQIDATVLAFSFLIALATSVIFGLIPALQASRSGAAESLKAESGYRTTSGSAIRRTHRLLIVAEVSLALVLLAGAGLLMRSFLRVISIDPGFRTDRVLTMRIGLPPAKYSRPEQVIAFYRQLLDRVRTLPGIEAAGAISALPLEGTGSSGTTTIDTQAVPPDQATPEADWRVTTPGYFEAMGIQLLRGRLFDDRDTRETTRVAVVDETLARTYFPNEEAIGKRLKMGGRQSTNPWMTIVGVVRHVRYRTLEARSRVQVYWTAFQSPGAAMALTLRAKDDPKALAPGVARAVMDIDPEQPVFRVRTMDELRSAALAQRRLAMQLFGAFAAVASLLAAIGIYGVAAYSVTQRTREIGIRMALGAKRFQIARLVLGQSLVLVVIGIAVGLAGSIALRRVVGTLLFDVRATDPTTFAAVALGLMLVALIATYMPARRAAGVDPVTALRAE